MISSKQNVGYTYKLTKHATD